MFVQSQSQAQAIICYLKIIIIFKMDKRQNQLKQSCTLHTFSIKAKGKSTKPKLNTSVCFCSNSTHRNKKTNRKCYNFQGPIFNKDRSMATQAFILPSQQKEFIKNQKQYEKDHLIRVKQAQESSDMILIPKPRSKNNYCNVCQQQFQEYLEHIDTPQHKRHIKNSKFNDHILELTHQFKQLHPKNIQISEQNQTLSNRMVQFSEINGRKRIKTQYQRTQLPMTPCTSYFQPFHFPIIPSPPSFFPFPMINYSYQVPCFPSYSIFVDGNMNQAYINYEQNPYGQCHSNNNQFTSFMNPHGYFVQ